MVALCSEESELLLDVTGFESLGLKLEDVESHGLGEGSALANGHDVTFLDSGESGGAVSSKVLVSLLKSVVLLDVMEVISSQDNSSLHLA